jgi:hypothetical protein
MLEEEKHVSMFTFRRRWPHVRHDFMTGLPNL